MKLEELDLVLANIERIEPGGSETASFGIIDDFLDAKDELMARLQAQLEALRREIAYYAWVETPAGRTTVSWGGDVETVWNVGVADVELHLQVVDERLRYRSRFLRLLVVVTRKLAIIARAFNNPLAAFGALQAGWELAGELQKIVA